VCSARPWSAPTRLAALDRAPLPEGLTLHALRRTFCSVQLALGTDVPYVMEMMGHTDPKVTLGIYAHVMRLGDEDRDRLCLLVEGAELALTGTGGVSGDRAEAGNINGRGGFRTCDLSRVKRALSH
jgi:Phage integrase family